MTLDDMARDASSSIGKHMDERLIELFGSREEAERLAHLYTIEYEPVQYTQPGDYTFRAVQNWRLRRKTDEELNRRLPFDPDAKEND